MLKLRHEKEPAWKRDSVTQTVEQRVEGLEEGRPLVNWGNRKEETVDQA